MFWDRAGGCVIPLRQDLEQPQGCFWLGQLQLSPWDQYCWVAAELCAAPISLSSCLWQF